MALERLFHRLLVLLPEAGAALDVGEEERERSRRGRGERLLPGHTASIRAGVALRHGAAGGPGPGSAGSGSASADGRRGRRRGAARRDVGRPGRRRAAARPSLHGGALRGPGRPPQLPGRQEVADRRSGRDGGRPAGHAPRVPQHRRRGRPRDLPRPPAVVAAGLPRGRRGAWAAPASSRAMGFPKSFERAAPGGRPGASLPRHGRARFPVASTRDPAPGDPAPRPPRRAARLQGRALRRARASGLAPAP